MADLTHMKPATLGRDMQARFAAHQVSADDIYAVARGNERFSDIVARLGDDHPLVEAHAWTRDHLEQAVREAERRYGKAVPHRTMWPTFLEVTAPRIGRRS